jgi:hypothetical protein
LTLAAANLAAGQQQLFAQNVGQAILWINDHRTIQPVDIKNAFFHDFHQSLSSSHQSRGVPC